MQQDNVTNNKKSSSLGLLFLVTIVIYTAASILTSVTDDKLSIPAWLLLIISELLIVVPAMIYILLHKVELGDEHGFRKIKPLTVLMSIILAFTVMPVVGFVNILTQFFVSNTMTQASDNLLEGSYIVILIISSIYGPICEEFVFRGVLFKEYAKITTPMKAALISGLFFGLMHLNVNQTCYALVLGVLFAIVNRASGSIFTSIIMHVTINLWNMLLLVVTNLAYKAAGMSQSVSELAEDARTSDMIYMYAGVYLVLAIIFGAISVPVVVFIAKHEGREDKLKDMFFRKGEDKGNVKVFLAPFALASIIISLFVIFGLDPLIAYLGWS